MRSDDIPADRIRFIFPRHEVTNAKKRDGLIEDMRQNGWQGRPLLLSVYGDGLRAWTGTHRLAAAIEAEIDLPVVIIEDSDLSEEDWEELEYCTDDEDLERLFAEIGLVEAAKLISQEIESNNLTAVARR